MSYMIINGKRWLTAFVVQVALAGAAFAAGGADIAGGSRFDPAPRKQEARAAAFSPVTSAVRSVVVTGHQNLTGGVNDSAYTVKYAADGTPAWRITYDPTTGIERGVGVTLDKNRDALMVATAMSAGQPAIYLARYRDNGTGSPTVVWSGTWSSGTAGGADYPQAIAYDPVNDRVYVAGFSRNSSGNDDYLLLAFANNQAGDNRQPLWARTFNGGGTDRAHALAVSPDGARIALTGESANGTDLDLFVHLWDSDGNQALTPSWRKAGVASFNDRGTALVFRPTGYNLLVTGYLSNGRGGDLYTAELSAVSGEPIWEATYDAGFDDQPVALALDQAGDVYLAATVGPLPAFSKIYLVKYHPNVTATPTTVWSATYDAGSADLGGAVAMTLEPGTSPTSGLFVSGWRESADVKKIVTMKYGRNTGRLLWEKEWTGVAGKNSVPVGIGLQGGEVATAAWTDQTQPLGGEQIAVGGSETTLVGGGGWSTNQWAGYYLYLVAAQSPENNGQLRPIKANDGTTLTLDAAQAFPKPIAAGDRYYIFDRDDIDYALWRQEKGTMDPPTGLTAQTETNSSVKIAFLDNTDNETGFKVYWRIGASGSWCSDAQAKTIPSADPTQMGLVNWTVAELSPDTDYYFKVAPYYQGGATGDFSAEANALTRGTITFTELTNPYIYADPKGGNDQAVAAACYSGGAPVFFGSMYADQLASGQASFDFYTVKLSRDLATVQWSDKLDGGYEGDDSAIAMAVDGNRETIVVGTSSQGVGDVGNIPSILALKYAFSPSIDGEGQAEFLWSDQLNGAGQLADQADAVAIQPVAPYSAVVVGHGNASLTQINFYARKISTTSDPADPQVNFTYESSSALVSGDLFPVATVMNAAGDIFVSGRVQSAGNSNWFVIKLDGGSGQKVWFDSFGGSGDDGPLTMTLDNGGDLYVAGYTTDTATGKRILTVAKYLGEATGSAVQIWKRTYPSSSPSGNSTARKIVYDAYANQLMVGGDITTPAGDRDLLLLRYDAAGDLKWARELRRSGTDETLTGLSIDPSGYIYLAGDSGSSPNTDIVAAIYTDSGSYANSFTYADPAGKDEHAAAIATNQFGEGFIAGHRSTAAGDKDFLALKVANTLPIKPTGLTATPQSDSSKVVLTWTNVNADTIPYLSRQVNGTWSAPVALPLNTATFTDSGLTPPNSYYCWRVYGEKGSVTTRYTETCATTTMAPPAPPTAVNPTPVTTNSLRLSWTNTAGNTGYRLERKQNVGGSYATVATLPANTISYNDDGLSNAKTYYYRLTVQTPAGWTVPSADSAPAYTAPNPVTGWASATAPNARQIDLSWIYYMSWDADSYRVERKTGAAGSWSTVGNPTTYTFSDTTVGPNTPYYYRVYARYKGVENPTPGPEQLVTTPLDPPTLLSATVLSAASFSATWSPVTNNTGYALVGKNCFNSPVATIIANPVGSCNGGEVQVAMAANATSGELSTAASNNYRAWYVVVRTKTSAATSADSNGILLFKPLAVTMSNIELPASNQLKPIWTDSTEDKFDVQRRIPDTTWPADSNPTDPARWTTVASGLPADTLNWLDTTVTNGTPYCYRVRAYTDTHDQNGKPADAFAVEKCQTPQAPPAPPQLTLSTPTPTTVKLEWVNTNLSSTDFEVFQSTYGFDSGGKPETYSAWRGWSKIATVTACAGGAVCSHTYTPARGTAVQAFVRMNFNGTLIDSQTVSPSWGFVQTVPSPPAIQSTAATSTSVTVNWWRMDSAYSHNIYHKKATDGVWSGPSNVLEVWNPNPYPHTIGGLDSGTQYQVRVESVGKTLESTDAPITTVWTAPLAPAKPTISGVGSSQATVSWQAVASATGYKLERSTDNATWTVVVNNQNILTFTDPSLSPGIKYWYRVKGVNPTGDSAPSEAESTTTVPAAAGMPLLITRSDRQITVGIRTVKGATDYKIYRKDGGTGATASLVTTVPAPYVEGYCGSSAPTVNCQAASGGVVDYEDAALTVNTTYCYAVAASNANGDGVLGPEYCGATSPYTPAALSAVAATPYQVQFTINPGAGGSTPTGYQLEHKRGDNWNMVARILHGTNSYTLAGLLAPGESGQFRLRAYKQIGDNFTTGINPAVWLQRVIIRDNSNGLYLDTQATPINVTSASGNTAIVGTNGVATLTQSSTGLGVADTYNTARLMLADYSPLNGDFDFSTSFRLPTLAPAVRYHTYARLVVNLPAQVNDANKYNQYYVERNITAFQACSVVEAVFTCSSVATTTQDGGLRFTRTGRSITAWVGSSKGNAWQPLQNYPESQAATGILGQIIQHLNRGEAMSLAVELDDTQLIGGIASPSPVVTVTMPSYTPGQKACPD